MEFLENKSANGSSSSQNMEVDMQFPMKPTSSRLGRPVSICTNFYKFKCNTGGRDVLFEYQVKTAPQLSCHENSQKTIMTELVKKLRTKLESHFENHVYWEGFIYSFESVDNLDGLEEEIEHEGVPYCVCIELHDELTFDNPKVSRFFRAFLNQLIRRAKLRLVRGGKHFDPRQPVELDGVNMYRAYFNTMKPINGSIYLNLNPSVKFFQTQSLLDTIYNLGNERRVKEELVGRSIMTLYNNRVYTIDEIHFDKSPRDTFFCDMHSKNKEMSFADYINENYKVKCHDEAQPMIRNHNKRTGQDVYLIPEFCVLTGITEQQKGKNFHAIKKDMFANAMTKASQANNFFKTIKSAKDYEQFTDKWKITVEETCLETKAYTCGLGTLVGGHKKEFNLNEMERDFSRAFNSPFIGTKIKKWAILYSKYSSKEHNSFMKQLKQTVTTDFEYACGKPLEVCIKGDDRKFITWTDTIKEICDSEKLDIVICIAPGRKGNSPIYEGLKYYLQTECPVPSQVILQETISKNFKSLRNIIKNVMIQISAKIGDTPWGFKKLPLMNEPTMLIGIDVCHRVGKNKKSVLGFVASLDKYVGKYYTGSVSQGEKQEIAFSIEKLFQEAIQAFIKANKIPPKKIIVYRDAVSEGQSETTLSTEVPQLRSAIQNLKDTNQIEEEPMILFILANKRIEQRFFTQDRGKLFNPRRGLVIESQVTRPDRFEFYMISHAGPTGLQCPVRYEVIFSTWTDLDPKDLYDLTNLLCYGFYNLQGAVKIPGPIMYAHTLCNQISKICQRKDKVADTPSAFNSKLYFI
jgi:aubergine